MRHLDRAELEAGFDSVRSAPAADGALDLIVARPREEQRSLLDSARLDLEVGLVGDSWSKRLDPDPEAQVTVMSSRAAALVSGGDDHDAWAQAGDQLFVNLDISQANLPAGARIGIGDVVLEVSEEPHTGCGKFSRRFGVEALKVVNSDQGRALRLRGLNARVVEPGAIAVGDRVRRLG